MDYFKIGIKTVLGTNEVGHQPSAAETVEKLVDRVTSSTLLEDRRDACRALKALSRKYRIEVGAQGMSALVQVLQNDSQDAEIISYALDSLCNVTAIEEFDEEADNPAVSVNVGEQFTEMFIKTPEHVSLVMGHLEEYDFRVRRGAIQLITTLIANKTRDLQELILVSPMGVSKLMDLLTDSREVIRNDALLLLIQLTKGNSNIQKIVAFENAFDKVFEIIRDEGCSDGGIVVEDCLILLLNLLKNNSSNQQFFKEGSYIQRLAPMFVMTHMVNHPDDTVWTPQKVSNVHCQLQVVRALVTPSNQQQVVANCQKTMRQSNLLEALSNILMSSGVPADILTETINAVAEVVRGDRDNQENLSRVLAPSSPPRPAIVVLLMSMINEKQMLPLRCAVLYAFQCYLFRNETCQMQVVQTLLPSTADEAALSTGQLLCSGLFSVDKLANWFSAVALMHTLVDNVPQKEELLRVLLTTPGGGHKPITLLEQCTNLLQQESFRLQSKVGLLMLLGVWLAHCPAAVRTLLGTNGALAYLTAQIGANEHDDDVLVQGLCAFLLGLCIQFNDNALPGQRREDICQLVIKRIGPETFCNKLSEVSRHEAYSRACKQPQIRAKSANELLLDYEYCKMFKGLEALVSKVVSGFDVGGIELTELTLSSEASALVAQYKGIIRGLDGQINVLQSSVQHLDERNKELERQLTEVRESSTQLADHNTLLKAQLAVKQNSSGCTGFASNATPISVEALNAAQFQANLYYIENLRLANELETLRQSLAEATQRANSCSNDQDDLLELLTDQENKIARYEQQITAAGLTLEADDVVAEIEALTTSPPPS